MVLVTVYGYKHKLIWFVFVTYKNKRPIIKVQCIEYKNEIFFESLYGEVFFIL